MAAHGNSHKDSSNHKMTLRNGLKWTVNTIRYI